MELTAIIKSLIEVGVLGLCAAVVIWQVVLDKQRQEKDAESFDKRTTALINSLTKQNEYMLEQIIEKVDTGHLISPEEDNNISKIEQELEKYLEETLCEIGANRVAIFRYHNGGKDYNGRSFLRMSMTNEVVKSGTAFMQPQSQNLFRSMFFRLTNSLETIGYDYINDVESIKDNDPGFYRYLKDFDVNAKYSVALYGNNHKVIGYLSIYFANKDDVDFDKIESCLNDKKVKIETLLSL